MQIGFELSAWAFSLWALQFWLGHLGFELWALSFRPGSSMFWLRASNVEFRHSGFGI
ncbi:hypothetical protein AXF42_Ash011582 [Apostasia shenzhenica]|uniref:Uncharacterized protein n=1 Tax=Apostasia shenzhenica TaxID=1088818 RepID=A0A2I0BB13_9ASPA|nr:hypothetical protein AXF42_Ash011582 [Apostasia shenzhenica]